MLFLFLFLLFLLFKVLNNLHMSFISSFEIIDVVIPEPCIFFWIPALVGDAAAVTHDGAKILFFKETAIFINGPYILLYNAPKKLPGWIISDICILDSFISASMLLSNAFLNFIFRLVVYKNSWGNLVPSNILIFIFNFFLVCF